MQFDIFADGRADSIPRWQDPAHVDRVTVTTETDRDHLSPAEIGRVGTNAPVHVVRIIDRDGETIRHETFPIGRQALARIAQINQLLASHRQIKLL